MIRDNFTSSKLKTFQPLIIQVMKKINLSIILFFVFGISTTAMAQLRYSLDSIEFYTGKGELNSKDIVVEKNQDGYINKDNVFKYNTDGTSVLHQKYERTFYPNNDLKEVIVYNCYPFKGSDTCLTTRHATYNELGDRTSDYYRSIEPNINNDNFEITFDFRTRDSTDFYPNGRLKNRYGYRYDFDTDTWSFRNQYEYFYSQTGETDSLLHYKPETNELLLVEKTHYQRFPNDLRELTTISSPNGQIRFIERQNVMIDGVERFSSSVEYTLNGSDKIISYQSDLQYANLYTEQIYNYFGANGSINYGGKVERYLLDDNMTADTIIIYDLNVNTGIHELTFFDLYYYTDQLSSSSNSYTNSNLIIYPNPTSNFIFIKNDFNPVYTPGKLYMIFDAKGRLIKEEELFTNQINISDLSSGNYYLQVGDKAAKPFVVQR